MTSQFKPRRGDAIDLWTFYYLPKLKLVSVCTSTVYVYVCLQVLQVFRDPLRMALRLRTVVPRLWQAQVLILFATETPTCSFNFLTIPDFIVLLLSTDLASSTIPTDVCSGGDEREEVPYL